MFPLLMALGAFWVLSGILEACSESPRRLPPSRDPVELKPVKLLGPTPEERKATALQARLHSLRAQHQAFTHYNDSAWLTNYATEHRAWLLENRDDILAECRKLHEQRLDPAYDVDMTYIHEHDQELYDRILWQARVLAIAERLCFEGQEEHHAKVRAAQRAAQASRIAELSLAYRDFEHYEQDEWIVEYASNPQRQQELLAEHVEILSADKEFHADTDFIEALKACAPGIYRRATWRVKALAIADKLSAKPRRQSPEEREAKIIRFRERMLNRLQVQAEDEIARKLQRFEAVRQLRERAEDMGLDDDVIERLEQELMGDLDQDDDGQSSGFKQL